MLLLLLLLLLVVIVVIIITIYFTLTNLFRKCYVSRSLARIGSEVGSRLACKRTNETDASYEIPRKNKSNLSVVILEFWFAILLAEN